MSDAPLLHVSLHVSLHVPPHVLAALPPGTTAARVCRVDRGGLLALTPDGQRAVRHPPRPDDEHDTVTTGDWLALGEDGAAVRLPRTALLARRGAGTGSAVQPLAANVDLVLVCTARSAGLPGRRLERLLTLAWDSGATPLLVLTKADLCPDRDDAAREAARHAPGVDVLVVSAATGELDALAPYVRPGVTLVLLGASGAGKSTLLNALAGEDRAATQATRDADGKGRHTTTSRELHVLPSGAVVVDTPGLRGVALQGTDEALGAAFADVEELASACRFADCAHDGEPGCAVRASVAAGDLGADRVDAWRRLQRELAWQSRRSDARLQRAEKQRFRARTKEQRARGGRP